MQEVADVSRLRETFFTECRRRGYIRSGPGLSGDLFEEAVIDESTVRSLAQTVTRCLATTDQQISQLCHQLRATLFRKAYLICVLESSKSKSTTSAVSHTDRKSLDNDLSKSSIVSSRIGKQIQEINNSLLAVISDELVLLDSACLRGKETRQSGSGVSPPNGPQIAVVSDRGVPQGNQDTSSTCSVKNNGAPVRRNRSRNNYETIQLSTSKGETQTKCSDSNKESLRKPSTRTILSPKSTPVSSVSANENSKGVFSAKEECKKPQTCVDENQREIPMNADFKDDENPYDNVITYSQHLEMFRKKKNNDLERSSSALSSKDNFMAVQSKHVSPSNVPRHNEGALQAGKHFQLLRLTSGFDFVLDDKGEDGNKTSSLSKDHNGTDGESVVSGSGNPLKDLDLIRSTPECHNAVNESDYREEPGLEYSDSGIACQNSLLGLDSQHQTVDTNNTEFRGIQNSHSSDETESSQSEFVLGAKTSISGSENEPEVMPDTGLYKNTTDSSTVSQTCVDSAVSTTADNTRASNVSTVINKVDTNSNSVLHSLVPNSGSEEGKNYVDNSVTKVSNSTFYTTTPTTSWPTSNVNAVPISHSSLMTNGPASATEDMNPAVVSRSAPDRPTPLPQSRSGKAISVPPPVAKKPVRFGSGKKPVPLPTGAKSAQTSAPPVSFDSQLDCDTSDSATTHDRPKSCNNPETGALDVVTKSPKPINFNRESQRNSTTPLVSKSPNRSETSAFGGRREGSVRGIVARFSGGDYSSASNIVAASEVAANIGASIENDHWSVSKKIDNNVDISVSTRVRTESLEAKEVKTEPTSPRRSGDTSGLRGEQDEEENAASGMNSVEGLQSTGMNHTGLYGSPIQRGEREEGGERRLSGMVEQENSSGLSLNSSVFGSESSTNDVSVDCSRHSGGFEYIQQASLEKGCPADKDAEHTEILVDRIGDLSGEGQLSIGDEMQHQIDSDGHGVDDRSEHRTVRIPRDASFTSDQEVKEAIFDLDAVLLQDSMTSLGSRNMSSSSSSAPTSPISLRRQQGSRLEMPLAADPTRRNSSMASYENWTINRAVTRPITSTPDFDSVSDDDDEDDDVVDDGLGEGVGSPCLTKRDVVVKGSKDSGLCDDISVGSDAVSTMAASDVAGLDLTPDGRIKDLRALQHMEQCAEEEEEEEAAVVIEEILDDNNAEEDCELEKTPTTQDEDNMDTISVASDIVYIPGSRGGSRIRALAQAPPPEEHSDQSSADEGDDVANEHGEVCEETTEDVTLLRRRPAPDPPGRAAQDSIASGSSVGSVVIPLHPNHKARLSREMSDAISLSSSVSEEDETRAVSMDTSYDEADSAREGMLKMRQLLVKGVLDSEKVYLDSLTVLINYKKVLETNSKSTQPVISGEDVESIFSNIETIHKIHQEFVTSLEPKVQNWHHEEKIGEIFKIMISKFIDFGNYLNNYKQACSTIHRCSQGNEQFQELAQKFVVKSTVKEVSSLEDALFKPVQRVQRNTLVLHDLIKYTPEDHPDHDALQKALKLSHHILETFATTMPQTQTTQDNRRLVKSSFLVELVNGVRKLRYVFLFSDLLVCTKREAHRNNKVTFDPKWFTPLSLATFDTKFAYTDDTKHSKKEDIDQLKSKLRSLKKELREEMKKYDDKDKHRSIVSLGGATRNVEKLRKKISQYEAQMILASPKLPFKISLEGGKIYTMLMTTDYEREEWKETIKSLCTRTAEQAPVLSSIFVQDLINSVKETPQVNKIGSVLLQKDEDVISGTLNVTIHKMNGLTETCDTYCCLEMDSFGHFFMKARTRICDASRDPAWNEDFELELESSQTLRFLCFKRGDHREAGDILLGRGALELSKQWLKGSFQEKTVSMNEISLVVSVRHTPAEKTMQRVPSRTSSATFGVKIASCARREGKTVPTIVTACLQEVEKRGLDEVGIYRVSGVTSELQRIKKLFDKNVRAGAAAVTDVDIHAVTGVLKLYFRELPEPLFTESSYQNFVDTLNLETDEAKAECMLSLLHSLPDTNYYTIVTLLEHLIKVARNVGENKMSIHNLSTIFGPTLLAPAANQQSSDPMEMICKGAEQVMRQSGVVNYLLGLAVSGRSLRRSSSQT